ncbi:response regulator [uncultured Aquimarina sp.]|uniref:response regulator n=1 Tax=uncultured Aquimarina sp. TaxID=575652 RepID=UPI00261EFBC0|nr:response regulator [uncultured Aquimarina sp.]
MIQEKFKILVVEDNINDASLIEYHLNKILEKPDIRKVDTFEKFTQAVHFFDPDVIICDYKLNGFTGMEVLDYVNKETTIRHFIFVTGTIYDEELAAETILSGATGYILKKHIKSLSTKLLPYFQKIANSKKTETLPPGHEKTLEAMQMFIESAKRDNEAIMQGYLEMKKTLEKYKYLKN